MSGASCTAISAPRSSPRRPVLHEFFTLFPATLELTLCAMIFAVVLGVPAGVIAASRRGGIYDQTLMGTALTGYSMPIFWWGLMLILVMSNTLGLTPVSGRIDLIKYYFRAGHRLHADRQPAVRPEGRLLGCRASPDPADHRAGHRAAGRHRAHDALVHAGGPGRGLCAHRPRQGPVAVARHRRPCPAQRADPGGHRHRPAGRHPAGRRGADRNDLLLARRRQVADRVDQPARLSGAAGRHPADLDHRHPRQSHRRPALWPHQSAGSAMPSDAALTAHRTAPPGPFTAFWRSFRENRGAVIGLAVVSIIFFVAIFANVLAPHDPIEQFRGFTKLPPIWDGGQRSALPARHRRARPRHALAPDVWRAHLALHRPRR